MLATKLGILFVGLIIGFFIGIWFMLVLMLKSMDDYWRGGR